jgi:hypothetical protein
VEDGNGNDVSQDHKQAAIVVEFLTFSTFFSFRLFVTSFMVDFSNLWQLHVAYETMQKLPSSALINKTKIINQEIEFV